MNVAIPESEKFTICRIAACMKELWPEFSEKESTTSKRFPGGSIGGRHQRRWISDNPCDLYYLPRGMEAMAVLLPILERVKNWKVPAERAVYLSLLPEELREALLRNAEIGEIGTLIYRMAEHDRRVWRFHGVTNLAAKLVAS